MTKKKKRTSKGALIRKAKSFCAGLFRYVLIICLSYLILAPILINISTAFTNPRDLSFPSSIWIPARFSIENWHVSMLMLNYGKALPYTLFFTAIITVLQTVSAMMAGYSFARLKFPGRSILFALSVFTIVVPPQMFMLPQYLFFKEFDIFGIFRLITGHPINLLKSGLYIYIFRQSFRALPKVLEEAAYMDGAGFLRTFTSIVVPSAGAGILTVAVLSFVWNWNDSYYIRLFDDTNINYLMLAFNKATGSVDESLATISTKIPATYAFLMKNPVYEGAIAKTAALLVFMPLVVLYMFVQRKFVQGVERSGIVG